MPGGSPTRVSCSRTIAAAARCAIQPKTLTATLARPIRSWRRRFARRATGGGPHVLGPMAVDARAVGVPGLLLAGDAAGFIDPMTGDGLRFALAGAAIAARCRLDVLAGRLA